MATNYNRPNLPYKAESLPNSNRYALLAAKKQPPTAVAVDGDINYIVDSLNDLDTKITDVEAGVLVGANNPQNAGLFVTTDGNAEAPTILWKKVDNTNVVPGSMTTACLADGAATHEKLGVGCVETENLSPNCVTSPTIAPHAILPEHINPEAVTTPAIKNKAIVNAKIDDRAVDTTKMSSGNAAAKTVLNADGAGNASFGPLGAGTVGTAQLVDASVTTTKIPDKTVTPPKISSVGANLGDVLTADGAGNASFIDKIGRILQIVNFEITDTLYDQTPCSPANPISFSAPFRLMITPKKTGSTIILSYGINISGGGNSYYGVVLCRNNQIWKVGTSGGEGGFDGGVTHGGYTFSGDASHYGAPCFSNIFVDTGTSGQQITYELKKAQQYVTLNRSGYDRQHTISTMLAVEIDI